MNWLKISKIANAQPYALAISCDVVSEYRKKVHMNPVFAEFASWIGTQRGGKRQAPAPLFFFSDCSAQPVLHRTQIPL